MSSNPLFMVPQRIVSLVPSQTELLFDLGLDDEIVGITKFCIHPANKVQGRTVVGGTKNLHLDRIHDLRPDLILANKEENTREQIEALRQHYSVLVTDVNTLPDALTMIREVGALVGREQRADEMARQIEQSFSVLPSTASMPSVAYFIWRRPYMVAASGTFIDAMLHAAGFRNAFAGLDRYHEITLDVVQVAQPDLIFLSSEPYPFTEKHVAKFQVLFPATEVLIVDGEMFSWYGSRLLRSADYFRSLHTQIVR